MPPRDQAEALLRSADPAQRRRAIVWLAENGDEDVLRLLARVVREDLDPSLRDLALSEGRKLKRALDARQTDDVDALFGPAASRVPSLGDLPDDEPAPSRAFASDAPSDVARDREYARTLVLQALDLQRHNDRRGAAARLARAVDLNPALRDDRETRGALALITGRDDDAGWKQLTRMAGASGTVGQGQPAQGTFMGTDTLPDDAPWGTALTWFAIYVIAVGATSYMLLASFLSLGPAFTQLLTDPEFRAAFEDSGTSIAELEALFAGADNVGPAALVVATMSATLSSVVTLLAQNVVIHQVARSSGGVARLPSTLASIIPAQTTLGTLYRLATAGALAAIGGFLGTRVPGGGIDEAALQQASLLFLGLLALLLVLLLVGVWWVPRQVARAHSIGWGSGCLSLGAGLVAFVVALCVFSFASNIITSALG